MEAPARRDPRPERTRAALIAAGRRLFSQRPIDAVTVDDLVRAAGVGKGSFYNHFSDREALARAISGEIRAAVEAAVDRANADIDDPARRVARACCLYLRFALDEPERAAFLVHIHGGATSLEAPLNRGLVADISAGMDQQRFRIGNREAGVLLVMGVTQIALTRLVHKPSQALGVELGRQLCAMLLIGLRTPEADAERIAAEASQEIIRSGTFRAEFGAPAAN